jgi:putative heme-binding domain-containing protein
MKCVGVFVFAVCFGAAAADIQIPTVKDSRLTLSLFKAEPEIVTPVGIAINSKGEIFVVESHTHFPKKDYPGPKHDLIKTFKPDGTSSVYAEGFRFAMNLAFAPDGELYLVHRNGVMILPEKKEVVSLITAGNYPHNGLGGIAFWEVGRGVPAEPQSLDPRTAQRDASPYQGWMYIGMGENLGEKYTIKGSDGSSHSGGGEGGNVFRCRPNGTKLEFVATGFWNAFALEFNRAGYLFCVDNDPDSRPPCRLIDVVMGGDYGYKFRYGRSGLHPYSAWNGEIPGTLPMVAGTGEAPSGILDCDRARLPADYDGALLVTSWGDHALEIYRPKPFGASVRAEREVLAQGNEWFRPVAIAAAPDGDIYFTDWVDRDYSVHRKGRIWRLSANEKSARKLKPPEKNSARERMLKPKVPEDLADPDPFIRSAAVHSLSREQARELLNSEKAAYRLGGMLALRRAGENLFHERYLKALRDSDETIRHLAIIWIGEQKLTALAPDLPHAFVRKFMSTALFRAYNETRKVLGASWSEKQVVNVAGNDVEDFPLDAQGPRVNKNSLPRGTGDIARGRRLFFHQALACGKCHRIEDHGGNIGPDLSVVSRSSNREKLVQSIIEPSREIAPQFITHTVETIDGETWSGLLESETKDGSLTLTTAEGKGVFLPANQIRSRSTSKVSLMPEGLEQALSESEWLDLMEFLTSRK